MQRFQTEERIVRVNRNKTTGENAFNGDHLETEKTCFWYFFRFVTCDLTLRPRNTYIYVFRTFFGFGNS